jgi:hypothetical protein
MINRSLADCQIVLSLQDYLNSGLASVGDNGERVCVLEFGAGDARIFRLK